MKKNHLRLAIGTTILVATLTSCNDGNFSGGANSSTPKKNEDPAVKKTPQNPQTPGPNNSDGLIFDSGKNCFNTPPKLHFMFVIDKTGSMDSSIATVIRGVGAFAQKISTITLDGAKEPLKDSQFAAVSYIDAESENMYVEWTKDSAVFSQELTKHNIKRSAGDDACEGGLMAARVGMNRLNASITSGEAVLPILIVISDNFSHMGTGYTNARNFDDSELVKAASTENLKPLLLIDSVPIVSDVVGSKLAFGCKPSGIGSPNKQWENLREKLAPYSGRTATAMGSSIDYSLSSGFDEGRLLTTIPSLIQSSVKMCK